MTIGPDNELKAVDIDARLSPGQDSGVLVVVLDGGKPLAIHLDYDAFVQLANRMLREISRADPPPGRL
jgi:hypothetical protein